MQKSRYIIISAALFLFGSACWYLIDPAENQPQPKKLKQGIVRKSAKASGKPEILSEIRRLKRIPDDRTEPEYGPNYLVAEYLKAKQLAANARTANLNSFVERGPANIAGRTRALLIDPSDATQSTWYAGSASGGIWKTTNAGSTWTKKSNGLPNLSTNALAQSASNPAIIYAGTGEIFSGGDVDGSGLFKSTDRGETWAQIANPDTAEDFQNISRIIVDPNDANKVVAVTTNSRWTTYYSSSIYRSTNGGATWTRTYHTSKYVLEDLDFVSGNFNIQFASVNFLGVLKSTDGGQTWTQSNNGIRGVQRVELATSPVDSNYVWISAVGGESGHQSDLYVSTDQGASWSLVVAENDDDNIDFLGIPDPPINQGNYDNIILCHPFDKNIVYVGGIDLWKFTLGTESKDNEYLQVVEEQTDFLDLINFGADYYAGRLEIGEIGYDSALSVEIRFGQGTQKAHRFTVNGQGPGVPDNSYTYRDYVDVPFQVWDLDSNRQLMASFRDQQEDGTWNLIEENTQDPPTSAHSREYIYIHKIPYSETPSDTIARNGGIAVQQMYFFWPVLTSGESFANLPVSKLGFYKRQVVDLIRTASNLSDAYNNAEDFDHYSGNNRFDQSNRLNGIHPDHHNLLVLNQNNATKTFQLLASNDGGVHISKPSTDPGVNDNDFAYVSLGYNTTQAYSADKAPGENRYLLGMQDNGTHYMHTAAGSQAAEFSSFLPSDGFEVIWHNQDKDKFIGSQFNNLFWKTTNGGSTITSASSGISDEDGPFISRLANSRFNPDRLYAIGATGVYVSRNFGDSWSLTSFPDDVQVSLFSADIKVSRADPNVVWAGTFLSAQSLLFVSDDGGESFSATNGYADQVLGSLSGIGTDPHDSRVAYALFSFAGRPKVLKTTDMGQSWVDISGFANGVSTRGFPDVAVNCLLAFTKDPNRLWVGSEIGIIETLDGGASWSLLQGNLPAVSIFSMKVQDDQIVLGTYGRGVWSITIPEIAEEVLFAPTFASVAVNPEGEMIVGLDFDSEFDSTEVFIDNNLSFVVQNNEIGLFEKTLENLGKDGNAQFKAVSYKGNRVYSGENLSSLVYETFPEEGSYVTDFSNVQGHFAGNGFRTVFESGFTGLALHTAHDYPENDELVYVLKTPIVVNGGNPMVSYKDVAIIETGEATAVFPEEEFYDYVVVEGSLDGKTWIPLADGYDAGFNETWEETYDNEAAGTAEMFVDHTLDLTEHFADGDVVLIRFRLFSDPFVAGWGWAIDDLYIQGTPLGSGSTTTSVNVFPNPVSRNGKLTIDAYGTLRARLTDIQGKMITSTSENQLDLSPLQLKPGIYFLDILTDGNRTVKKLVVD